MYKFSYIINLYNMKKEQSHIYRAIGGEVSSDGDFLLFENNRYTRKGFLFKSFVMSAIVSTEWFLYRHDLFFFIIKNITWKIIKFV